MPNIRMMGRIPLRKLLVGAACCMRRAENNVVVIDKNYRSAAEGAQI
jgi:hypothetical protein